MSVLTTLLGLDVELPVSVADVPSDVLVGAGALSVEVVEVVVVGGGLSVVDVVDELVVDIVLWELVVEVVD